MSDYNVESYIISAIEYYKTGTNHEYFARSKYLYGWYLTSIGNYFDALEVLMEAYLIFKRYGNEKFKSLVLSRLSYVQFQTGATQDAVRNLETCIQINRKLNNISNIVVFSRNKAVVQYRTGLINDALSSLESIKHDVEISGENNQFQHYLAVGIVEALLGNIDRALRLINETDKYPSGFKREIALRHEYLGWVYNLDGRYDDAVKMLKSGVKLSLEIAPESALISQTKRLLADAFLGLKKFDLAQKTAKEALKVAEKIRERSEVAACYRIFAQVEQSEGNGAQAKIWYDKAIDIFVYVKSRYELAVTRYLAAMSGLYENGEKAAMLYLAKEYFKSENIEHYIRLTERELIQYRQPMAASMHPDEEPPVFIVRDKRMMQLVKLAENVAPSAMTIFLTGPTGSGKDQLARYIHNCSGRKGKFVIVNSAAIPDSMVEAELFGFRRGAFTGAEHNRTGLLEEADGGTFYLNEIADATPEFQAKLLEVIETKFIRQLGSNTRKPIDIRIIAATNNDLEDKMKSGRFRRDLYHRLNEIPIELMPLSDRPDDIRALVEYFIMAKGHKLESASERKHLDNIMKMLIDHPWPGHVRELKAEVNRWYLLAGGNLEKMVEQIMANGHNEYEQLIKALEQTGWNRRETARLLGISEGAVRYRIKKYDITQDVGA
ncbi:MAG: sigma 54-interacting transcriptional regulator [Candidatus Zixiibacteriota bacterium]